MNRVLEKRLDRIFSKSEVYRVSRKDSIVITLIFGFLEIFTAVLTLSSMFAIPAEGLRGFCGDTSHQTLFSPSRFIANSEINR